MAATAPIDTKERAGEIVNFPVAASTTIYAGTLVAKDASGNAVPASDTAGLTVVGRAEETVDNSAGDAADLTINVKRGVFKLANSGTDPVDADDLFDFAYVEDDATVNENGADETIRAGIIIAVDSDGVWIDTRFNAVSAASIDPGAVDTDELAAGAVTADKIEDGAATPAKTINVDAVTATVAGDGTGVIADTATHATVTSADAAHLVTLPAPTPGRMVVIDNGATAFELQTSAPATIAINGGSGAGASSTVAANETVIAICISATAWKAIKLDADSDVAKLEAATA